MNKNELNETSENVVKPLKEEMEKRKRWCLSAEKKEEKRKKKKGGHLERDETFIRTRETEDQPKENKNFWKRSEYKRSTKRLKEEEKQSV